MNTLEEERARLRRATTALNASLDIREHLLSLDVEEDCVRVVLAHQGEGGGLAVDLPRVAMERLVDVLESLGDRQDPQVMPLAKELTTGEVAELLGVTRGHVVQLIDTGVIPAHRVGPRRRVRQSAALAYLRDEQRLSDLSSSGVASGGPSRRRRPKQRAEAPLTAETREVVRRYSALRPPPAQPDHPAG